MQQPSKPLTLSKPVDATSAAMQGTQQDSVDNTSAPAQTTQVPDQEQRPFPRRLIAAGLSMVALLLSSFTVWSLLAPIEGAVVSPGIVSVASHRKQVQHLEGGIVEAILVREGDRVAVGQLLIQLRDVQPAALLRQLERQYFEAQAVVARLLAERDDRQKIAFPKELLAHAKDPSVTAVMTGQRNILVSRRTLIQDRQSLLEHKIAQAQEEIKGYAGQAQAKNRQREFINEELSAIEVALAKKLVRASEAFKLRQQMTEADADLSAHESEIGRLEQTILEMRLQISEARAAQIAEITEELRIQRAEIFDLSQKIVAARDVLHRTKILSPIDGYVVNLQIHTQDGVIAAGQPLLEVVPTEDDLVIYAFVDPDDIDEVRIGMSADVQLTSFTRRKRVPLEGVVAGLSADRISDPETGLGYFRARIELNDDIIESAKTTLVAGMGAEVFIRTGARTLLDYLLSPITRSLQHGLREN
jgi:epimerase transport system membrane fusion protein